MQCPAFVSSSQYDLGEELGKHLNVTWTLATGEMCYVEVDATQYLGRVHFADVQGYLGIDGYDPEFDIAEKITFNGEVGQVLIYNAAETGSLRFTISFSAATRTVTTAALAMLATGSLLWL